MSKKIVIASILKPVDDVRAYGKIAQSLAKTNKYEVNIIGKEGKSEPNETKIHFHPHLINRNNWVKRALLNMFLFLRILFQKPDVLIITTFELIFTALLVKTFSTAKIIYDVQENHEVNLRLKNGLIRSIFAPVIRLIEWIGSKFIDHFWLAEACYSEELSFLERHYTILENKAKEPTIIGHPKREERLLFSGTLSVYSGVEIALNVMLKFIQNIPSTKGIIIGQIHDSHLENELTQAVKNHPNIQLICSKNPIPHEDILAQIQLATLGIISYQSNRINQNKIPTKLYEYSRHRLPYLVQQDTTWAAKGSQLGGAIPFDFSTIDKVNLPEFIKNASYSFPNPYPNEDTWEAESVKMIDSIEALINKS